MQDSIFVFGAHSDDFVIGAGGTIANYVKQGKIVISIVFSYGENSHPWLKEKVVQKMRGKEALESSKVLGCQTYIFNLKENHFLEEYEKKKVELQLRKLVRKYKPYRIFTHSPEDPHPDHRATYKLTLDFIKKIKLNPEIYVYSIWNPISLKTKVPTLYEDISKTFGLKIKAFKLFHSQKFHAIYPLIGAVFFRALRNGFKIKGWFAEKFYKVKL